MEKLTQPRIPNLLKEDTSLSEVISRKYEDLAEYSFNNQSVSEIKNANLSISTCRFNKCNFSDCRFKKCQFSDVVFSYCDLSNIHFTECGFFRVEFIGCKLTGTNLADSILNHTLFKECTGQYINLSGSKQRNLLYSQCNLQGAGFDSCQLTAVEFENCRLTEAEFHQTSLKGIDLSTSEISGIRVSATPGKELRGAVVTSLQALDLARLLGIVIQE